MSQVDWNKFSDGWASGSMVCSKCNKVFNNVRFLYSCHDKVEGEWPKCCGMSANFSDDWVPDNWMPDSIINGRVSD